MTTLERMYLESGDELASRNRIEFGLLFLISHLDFWEFGSSSMRDH